MISQQVLEWQAMALRATLLRILKVRFHATVPKDLKTAIAAVTGPDELGRWLELAATVPSPCAFRAAV
jgi:hypothetical protein